jgi:hypothetical protein
MPRTYPTDDELRAQIEAATAEAFPVDEIEERIADGLRQHGRFSAAINADDLVIILRNLVYQVFAEQRVAGKDLGLVHNIPRMMVKIKDSRAEVAFIVHIHKPIIAFIKFKYALENDPHSNGQRLRLNHDSLEVEESTRRFDLKAKAALTAINVDHIARKEMNDFGAIICRTLPPQLEKRGIVGHLSTVHLRLVDDKLQILLEGEY